MQSKLRILLLCERVGPEGGIERYLQIVVPALQVAGCEIQIAARSVDDSNAFGAPAAQIGWSDEHDPPSAPAAAQIQSLIATFRPDLVAAHSVLDSGVLAAAQELGRMFVHLHDHRVFCPNGDRLYPRGGGICAKRMGFACAVHAMTNGCAYGPRPRTLQLISRRGLVRDRIAAAEGTIVLSRYMSKVAVLNGCDPARVQTIDPPLANDAFGPAPRDRPCRNQILFIGRVVPQKGLRSLIRALARIDSERRPNLQIAGEGPELADALADANALSVRVQALGSLGSQGVQSAIDSAMMVAVPSLWGEPFGLVGIEALARGRPVVAYDSGAIGEWLGDGGVLVRRGDEAALARAIESLNSEIVWQKAAIAGWESARRYDLQTHVTNLLALYRGTPPSTAPFDSGFAPRILAQDDSRRAPLCHPEHPPCHPEQGLPSGEPVVEGPPLSS